MTLNRRQSLKLLTGGTLAVASASSVGFFLTRSPTKALQPWEMAGGYEDPRKQALSFGLLAANPHNLQPWLIDLPGDDQIVIYRDKTRDLPHTDPFARQLTIGMGCFIEQTAIAAAQMGFHMDTDLFPHGEDGPVAIATLTKGADADPLFAQIANRRSCKEPYTDKVPSAAQIEKLSDLAQIITDPDRVAAIRDLTWAAWQTEAATPRTHKESVDLMRFGKSEINANPDGISLGGWFFETMILLGSLNRAAMLDPDSISTKEGHRIYQKLLMATPAYAVITTPTNTRIEQINAGRQWARLNLTTTAMGLALHPVSQALQEFEEMRPHYETVHGLLANPGHTVQMLGRLGHGPTPKATPRWPLETRLTNDATKATSLL